MYAINAATALLGVASHVFYFNRGEHHMWPMTYLQIFLASIIGSTTALVQLYNFSLSTALSTVGPIAASYLVGTYTSLLVYRAWLSSLNKFPGPWMARISGVWLIYHLRGHDGPWKFEALHKRYGKYVRIGPNDLSITDADAHEVVYGHGTRFRKSIWYDGAKPYGSMLNERDKTIHDRLRRTWAPAFSDRALREYEPKVKVFNDKLVKNIQDQVGEPINASKWFNLYSFDVMGRLAFGKDYGMLDDGKRHWALDVLTEFMAAAPQRLPIWIIRVLSHVPFALAAVAKFHKFCVGELEWKVNNQSEEGDITGWLLKGYKGIEKPAAHPLLQGDMRLIIVAGSDTTSATLTFLFYELAKRPEEVKKLRRELRPLTQGDWKDADIRHASHLNGAIYEALRLYPPVPSGTERQVPASGAQIKDVFLPEQTQFWMPQYVIGRDEDHYAKATEFVPERWYSKPEMIKHKNAFAAFNLGYEMCIGKNLAMIEMRTLTVQLLLAFDVALAPGEDGHRLLYETEDHFTLDVGQLDLVFTPASS